MGDSRVNSSHIGRKLTHSTQSKSLRGRFCCVDNLRNADEDTSYVALANKTGIEKKAKFVFGTFSLLLLLMSPK